MFGVRNRRVETIDQAEPQRARGPSDAELMSRFVSQRDSAAFAALVDRHGGTVWGVCRRVLNSTEDAEDAFQAVFLVLAKKGGTVRNKGAVGSWLYGVAYRTAMKARRDLARRTQHEKDVPPTTPPQSPAGTAACRELQRLLDEEVDGLPEKLKAPFVLCCIEGMSKSEAAGELNWKEGTVSGRLAQARKQLQRRLVQRGVTLSAALTVLALTKNGAASAVSPLLLQSTINGLAGVLAGHAATGLSSSAIALAEGVVRTLAIANLKVAGGAVLALTVVIGGAAVATQRLGQAPQAMPVLARPLTFTGPPRPFLEVIDEQVMAVAFSPDGKQLVTAGGRHVNPGQIVWWDTDSLQKVQKVRRIQRTRCVAFAPDGKQLACGEFGGRIALRDAQSGKELSALQGHTIGVNGLAYSQDGNWLVSAGLDHVVKLWDIKAQVEKRAFFGHTESVYTVAFYGNGKRFVTGSQDKTARIWDVNEDKPKFILAGHQGPVEQVAISPDDKVIATASWDQRIKLWNAETGAELSVLEGHQLVSAVAFSNDGAWIASAGGDGELRLWNAKTHTPAAALKAHPSMISSIAFSPDSKLLASGSLDRTAKLWDVATKKERGILPTSESRPVSALAYAPDGKRVALATHTNAIELFDSFTGNKTNVLSGHTDKVTCLAYAPDGRTLASGSQDKTVRLWDLATGTVKQVLEKHTGGVRALAYSRNGKRLASAGEDGCINVWDPKEGSHRQTYRGHTGPIYAVAFARDSALLASGGVDNAILLWAENADKPGRPEGHEKPVRALLFAGDALVSGSDDGTVKIWERAAEAGVDGAPAKARTLKGHAGMVLALAHLDGTDGFVSGGSDGAIMQWELATGAPRNVLMGHRHVSALAIHPAGAELLSGGFDTGVLRWPAGNGVVFPAAAQPVLPMANNAPVQRQRLVELKDFYQDFRGGKAPVAPLVLFGNQAAQVTRLEDRGVHIAVQANPQQSGRIGLDLAARFRGDFEITAGYEIVHADQPREGHGVGVTMLADLDSPTKEVLELMRAARVDEGQVQGCVRITASGGQDKYQIRWFPSGSKAGHLRITRKGTEVIYSVREGGAANFKELCRFACGTADLRQVRFAANMGFAPNSVDVFLKDLRIGPPGSGALAAADPAEPVAEAAVSPTRGRFFLILFGLGALLTSLGVFTVFYYGRRKRRDPGKDGQEPAVPDNGMPPATVVFECSDCNRRLRVRKTLAGKEVTCPRCGTKVSVPTVAADDSMRSPEAIQKRLPR
jgi:RNA polymerase sigma factor (sigma-70 family)